MLCGLPTAKSLQQELALLLVVMAIDGLEKALNHNQFFHLWNCPNA
jgi:hypothetical protein